MAVRDRIHVHAVGWALALLVGAALVLLGTLNYPIIEGKPVASGRGLNGDKLLEIFLNKQCIDSSCEQVGLGQAKHQPSQHYSLLVARELTRAYWLIT